MGGFGIWAQLIGDITIVFARVSMIMLVLPGLDGRFISVRYRIAVTFLISLMIAPTLGSSEFPSQETFSLDPIDLAWEFTIGATLGISIRAIVYCLQILGATIAQSISLSQILGANVATEAQSTVSNILVLSGIAVIMITGFLEAVLLGIAGSYDAFPAGQPINLRDALGLVTFAFARASEISLQLAAPFLLLATYYNAVLAVVNKAMPQLLVSFIGVPAILIVAIALMVFSVEPILKTWLNKTGEILEIVI